MFQPLRVAAALAIECSIFILVLSRGRAERDAEAQVVAPAEGAAGGNGVRG